jgi:putative two-component system response regulator
MPLFVYERRPGTREWLMSSDRKTLFLVDDDLTILKAGKDALSGHYKVITLNSGRTLLEMTKKALPDLILLDVNMPELGGYETIGRLKANNETARIPVIFLTALNDVQEQIEGLSLGAVDYITKPFSAPLLLKRIEIHLLIESQNKELLLFNNSLKQMVDEKTQEVVKLKNALISTMAEIVECRDEITGNHIVRTQNYVKVIMNFLKENGLYAKELSGLDMDLVIQSSQLHDVGKIAISDVILNKPAKLTHDEFEAIKSHTVFGEKIIASLQEKAMSDGFLEYARVIAASHHEKWDGSGYPNGLSGPGIPLIGRVMAIADVYDALVGTRPYKKALSHDEAVDIVRSGSGSHFDPLLVDAFISVHSEFEAVLRETQL